MTSLAKVPVQITIAELVSSRYADGRRPESWERRCDGIDVVRIGSGETVKLLSDGGQSPPQRGWTVILTDGDAANGYRWTLYGLPRPAVQ